MNEHLAAALVGLVVGAVGGWLTPYLVRRLPEPPPPESPKDDADLSAADRARLEEPPKELYADLGRLPWLGGVSAAISAGAGAGVGAALGWDWLLCLVLPLVPIGTMLAIIDFRTRLLPSIVVLPATLAALVYGGAHWAVTGAAEELVRGAIGLIVVRSIFWVLWFVRQAGMGFGDVRLSALLGCVLGYAGGAELLVGLYAAFLIFAVPGFALAIIKRDRSVLKRAYAFGPFLLAGAWLGIVVGEPLMAAVTA